MKIEIDGKVYSYVLSKIEDMKARLDGLSIKLADLDQHLMRRSSSIDASLEGDIIYESVFDEVKSIKGHLDDLHHIMTGGRVE